MLKSALVAAVAAAVAAATAVYLRRPKNKKPSVLPSIKEEPEPRVAPLSIDEVARGLRDGRYKNVIVMAGAGMSTSAGIPDFRTPGTGLYDQLRERGIDDPTDLFDLQFFKENPAPFHRLALELLPGAARPTDMHRFVAELERRDVLLRCFTQNIDGLELDAGVSTERLVQAHGGFQSASCVSCGANHDVGDHIDLLRAEETPRCTTCGGLVKFDVVFFGEGLPARFHHRAAEDFKHCDLLLIVGTSLSVQPFASLVNRVPDGCPRVLINRDPVLRFDDPHSTRDAWWSSDIDGVARRLSGFEDW